MLNGMAARMSAVRRLGPGCPRCAGIAALAAVLANVVNNLPATLVLVPLVAAGGPAASVVLLGVNIDPILTYAGSLSNLLWRGRAAPAQRRRQRRRVHLTGTVHRACGPGDGGASQQGQRPGSGIELQRQNRMI